ncbi:hypothetical protein B0H14DRAFT_3444649 [Mycena olivaceomarginata]|nr:hypothetical protein B0H14DRAFT_3444649 [Mycena olivaceomarginata]
MPPTAAQIRFNRIITCLTATANTFEILSKSLKGPFLDAISNTTQSLLRSVQTVKQNKSDCTQLLEQTYELLNAIIIVHTKSDAGGELSLNILNHVGQFMEYSSWIHSR